MSVLARLRRRPTRDDAARRFHAARAALQPRFAGAVLADARAHARHRGEPVGPSRLAAAGAALRLALVGDAFLAQVCYRAAAALRRRRVPIAPSLAHRAAIVLGQVSIGAPVVVQPGLYLLHGQVVIDGVVDVGRDVRIAPFVTIGLTDGIRGPTIGDGVRIGTGASVLGPIRVGRGARIGAGAVVLDDVADATTHAGVPSRPVDGAPTP